MYKKYESFMTNFEIMINIQILLSCKSEVKNDRLIIKCV